MRGTKKLNIVRLVFGAAALLSTLAAAQAALAQGNENKAILVENVRGHSDPLNAELVDKFVNFNLSPQCWARFAEKDSQGVTHASRIAYAIRGYAELMGYGDLDDAVSGVEVNRRKADAIISQLQGNYSYTVNARGLACDDEQYRLMLGYSLTVMEFFSNSSASSYGMNRGWRPRGAKALIILNMSPTAKAFSITADGTNFNVTAPANAEPEDWGTVIEKGLAKGGK